MPNEAQALQIVADYLRHARTPSCKVKVAICGGSVTFAYSIVGGKKKNKKHRHVGGQLSNLVDWDKTMMVSGGSSPQQIYEEMLKDPDYRTDHVVLCVLAYNGTPDEDYQFT